MSVARAGCGAGSSIGDGWLWELSALAWVLLASYYLTGHDHMDWQGHALGRDFVNIFTAGHLIAEGNTLEIFHPGRRSLHRRHAPPVRPAAALPLLELSAARPCSWPRRFGLLPYFPGAVGLDAGRAGGAVAGAAGLLPAGGAAAPRAGLALLAFLSPAISTNIGLGQNGAITAALLMGGLSLLETRPYAAGALLGLLIFKPQIAILLPVMVLAGGQVEDHVGRRRQRRARSWLLSTLALRPGALAAVPRPRPCRCRAPC